MELTISTAKAPYGILALLALSPELSKAVNLTAKDDTVLEVSPQVSLVGTASVTRYLARRANVFDEQLPENQAKASLFDKLVALEESSIIETVENRTSTFLFGSEPTPLDFLTWGSLLAIERKSAKTSSFVEAVGATKVAKDAAALLKSLKSTSSNDTLATSEDTQQVPELPETCSSPSTNPLDAFRNLIAVKLAEISKVDRALIYDALDAPRQLEHGDFAVALPRLRVKGNPTALAKTWADAFPVCNSISSVTAMGPFINFKINPAELIRRTTHMVAHSENYGFNKSGAGKTAIVEFSSPNIAKPFHAGHLRSTIIGAFIRNVYHANGWKTIAMNYLGDWGKQYGLLAIGFSRHGNEEALTKDPIKHLYDVYVQINRDAEAEPTIHDEARAYFKKMEDGDEEALALWRRFRDLSIVKYKDVYARLNISFDVYSGESQVGTGMQQAMDLLKSCNLLVDSEGAKIIDLKAHKLGVAVVEKKDGTTLYLTRDIGAAKERYEKYKFDKMIYVVASQQDLHLKQLFKTLELMGFEWAKKCEHINFGMVQGMSTRKGTVVFLEEILDEAKDIMHEVMKKNEKKYKEVVDPESVADEIGISAVKIQDNSARRVKNYEFDRARMFSFEGDTGPYIQYAHARLMSIERKSGLEVNKDADVSLLTEAGAIDVLRTVAQYPDLVRALMNGYEPCNVVTYAFKLAHDISGVFDQLWVRGAEPAVADARLLMYWCARVTLGNAMTLLGLRPLERM
ncbi:hypothetical protein CLU79DRAFT_746434 [Phycomyces nitens]|nr:hypothetical protein CLU79DRAFT_746434 [Phycomyces nitens]